MVGLACIVGVGILLAWWLDIKGENDEDLW